MTDSKATKSRSGGKRRSGGENKSTERQGSRGKRRDPRGRSFPVVALGASAGGLEALSDFFSAVPDDSGMAFVVIQHLAPSSTSILSNLLGRDSKLQIADAVDGATIEPDHAYVIPPNRFLSINRGVLHLSEPPTGPRLPIDYFLRSLANDRQDVSVAVILSGTGTDGTLGVQAIKNENGLVLAQDPDTAEHGGMPRSAIDTDLVDFILPPQEMPERLIQHMRRRPIHEAPADGDKSMERPRDLQNILEMLRDRRGHDLSLYKTSTIVRRVGRRMTVHDIEKYSEYLRLLHEQPEELDILFNEMLIRVSGFFRDPEAFEALQKTVVPSLFEELEPDEPIRVWVPGCATGEEAYSIAILLQEWMHGQRRSHPVQIFATDIDTRALDTARIGRYPANIAMDVSAERLDRHFTKRENQYEVNKAIRGMLVFAEQSVVRDPPFSRVSLVSCRNLLIYMSNRLQRRVLPLFHYALNADGYLFLGTSESIGDATDMFTVVDRKMKIFQRQDGSSHGLPPRELPMFLSRSSSEVRRGGATGAVAEKPDIGELTRRVLLRDHTPACVILNRDDEIVYFHGSTGRFLEPASGTPTVDIMRMARRPVAGAIRTVIQRARASQETVRSGATRIEDNEDAEAVRFIATPLATSDAPQGALLLLMEEVKASAPGDAAHGEPVSSGEQSEQVESLQRELDSTREALQATIEELETSNEELQSSNEELQSGNEELQSSNEELETSREELQSVNEELQTVNVELENKVEELARTNDDIKNLLASTAIGIVFLDETLRIKRFTPAVTDIVPLIDSDIGRPFGDIVHKLEYQGLSEDLEEVIRTELQKEREVIGRDGRQYLTRMTPYRIAGGRVRGAVLAFIDLTDQQRLALLGKLMSAVDQSASMVVLTDLDGRVDYVNKVFTNASGYQAGELIGEKATKVGLDCLGGNNAEAMATLRDGKVWRNEVHYRRKDGSPARVAAFAAPIRSAGNEISHAVAYLDELPETH